MERQFFHRNIVYTQRSPRIYAIMVAQLPNDWIMEELGDCGQLIRVWHAGRTFPWKEITSKHSFPLLKTVHDVSIPEIFTDQEWKSWKPEVAGFGKFLQ